MIGVSITSYSGEHLKDGAENHPEQVQDDADELTKMLNPISNVQWNTMMEIHCSKQCRNRAKAFVWRTVEVEGILIHQCSQRYQCLHTTAIVGSLSSMRSIEEVGKIYIIARICQEPGARDQNLHSCYLD